MNQKQKVAFCGALVAIFGFIGTIATPLCAGVPAPYNVICLTGGKTLGAVGDAIARTMPDGGEVDGGSP